MKTYLVDDDHICNFVTEQVLTMGRLHEQVRTFISAEEALATMLEKFPENVPDLIFLDLNMPVMSGWEFLDALQPYQEQLKGRCRIYILTTSLRIIETNRSAESKLIAGLIHKPMTKEDLEVLLDGIEIESEF